MQDPDPVLAAQQGQFSTGQILALCWRAFGEDARVESIQELTGGTFNTVYKIALAGGEPMVLRIAPDELDADWDSALLMRREHSIRPFFASIAEWMPSTLFVDFTHQLVGRDYLFQSFMPGERWEDIARELTQPERETLWLQFGRLVRQIHSVTGEAFGHPYPGRQYPTWSETVLARLRRIRRELRALKVEHRLFSSIIEFAGARRSLLDRVQVPHLLHGDLWLFNLLVERGPSGARITALLDSDRAWWGDPQADWTMFVLSKNPPRDEHLFWQGYGPQERSEDGQFRMQVYDAMNIGTAWVWAIQHQDSETIALAHRDIARVHNALSQ